MTAWRLESSSPPGRPDRVLRKREACETFNGQQTRAVHWPSNLRMLLKHGHASACPGKTIRRIEAGRTATDHQDVIHRNPSPPSSSRQDPSDLLPSMFPLPPKGDPEGERDQLHVKAEALPLDVEEVEPELVPSGDI